MRICRIAQRAVVPVVAVVLFLGSITAGSAEGSQPKKARLPLVKSGSVPLGNCPAKDVDMRVSIARSVYTSSQPVDVVAEVRNRGSLTCRYGGNVGRAQSIGPCGAFSLQVFTRSGADVWPGRVAYACPEMGIATLEPRAVVRATGAWPRTVSTGVPPGSTSPGSVSTGSAPAGTYRLVIDGRISFTITLR